MAVGKSKQKKMDVRVDFTPMVDMMMLLITFFMLCTSLAKPQTMELSMPTADNQLYYVAGLIKPENPKCLVKTNWGAKGIRNVIINHTTEDGTTPTIDVMKAKQKLDAEKNDPNSKMSDSIYNQRLAQIKAGNLDGKRINTLTIIIKATDNATYKNLVDALDEMNICSIGKYVIDKINDQDLKLLEENKVKL